MTIHRISKLQTSTRFKYSRGHIHETSNWKTLLGVAAPKFPHPTPAASDPVTPRPDGNTRLSRIRGREIALFSSHSKQGSR